MNFVTFLGQFMGLAAQVYGALAQLAGGAPVTIKTYLGKKHVSIVIQEID